MKNGRGIKIKKVRLAAAKKTIRLLSDEQLEKEN